MKKIIAILLSVITIIISGWLITQNLDHLDIPSNKNDTYATWEKQKIDKRTDIDFCEKQVLKSKVDQNRKNDRRESEIAIQAQSVAFIVIIVQLILLVFIAIMPIKISVDK